MRQKYDIVVADATGNITIFVLTKIPRSEYAGIAQKLLALQELKGEQVCFVIDDDNAEMSGLEFCGNASRSFGLLKAKRLGIQGEGTVSINMSGSKVPLEVFVNTGSNFTRIRMPLPLKIQPLNLTTIIGGYQALRMDFDGITHVIVFDMPAVRDKFEVIKEYIQNQDDPPAIGVMFFDRKTREMTPVVYVKDVDTTYFEGSCGSGTTAAAIALALEEERKDASFTYEIDQPAGCIASNVVVKAGQLQSVTIEGVVQLSSPISVEL